MVVLFHDGIPQNFSFVIPNFSSNTESGKYFYKNNINKVLINKHYHFSFLTSRCLLSNPFGFFFAVSSSQVYSRSYSFNLSDTSSSFPSALCFYL